MTSQVIEAHGEDFDEMNVATCFHELAKVAKGKSKEELEEMHLHETFQNLVGRPHLFFASLNDSYPSANKFWRPAHLATLHRKPWEILFTSPDSTLGILCILLRCRLLKEEMHNPPSCLLERLQPALLRPTEA